MLHSARTGNPAWVRLFVPRPHLPTVMCLAFMPGATVGMKEPQNISECCHVMVSKFGNP